MSWWQRRFSWRVEVVIAPQSETQRRHAVVVVRASDRAEAAVRGLCLALAGHPHKVWRDVTLSVLPDTG